MQAFVRDVGDKAILAISLPTVGLLPTVEIIRRADGFRWNGTAWQVSSCTIALQGASYCGTSYTYEFDNQVAGGSECELLVIYACATPSLRTEESWTFSKIKQRHLGAVLSDDGAITRCLFWIDVCGQQSTVYQSATTVVVDSNNGVVSDLGLVQVSGTGLFSYLLPSLLFTRNMPYTFVVSAVRGQTTDIFRVGCVRV